MLSPATRIVRLDFSSRKIQPRRCRAGIRMRVMLRNSDGTVRAGRVSGTRSIRFFAAQHSYPRCRFSYCFSGARKPSRTAVAARPAHVVAGRRRFAGERVHLSRRAAQGAAEVSPARWQRGRLLAHDDFLVGERRDGPAVWPCLVAGTLRSPVALMHATAGPRTGSPGPRAFPFFLSCCGQKIRSGQCSHEDGTEAGSGAYQHA
jgi:hypothetical protein